MIGKIYTMNHIMKNYSKMTREKSILVEGLKGVKLRVEELQLCMEQMRTCEEDDNKEKATWGTVGKGSRMKVEVQSKENKQLLKEAEKNSMELLSCTEARIAELDKQSGYIQGFMSWKDALQDKGKMPEVRLGMTFDTFTQKGREPRERGEVQPLIEQTKQLTGFLSQNPQPESKEQIANLVEYSKGVDRENKNHFKVQAAFSTFDCFTPQIMDMFTGTDDIIKTDMRAEEYSKEIRDVCNKNGTGDRLCSEIRENLDLGAMQNLQSNFPNFFNVSKQSNQVEKDMDKIKEKLNVQENYINNKLIEDSTKQVQEKNEEIQKDLEQCKEKLENVKESGLTEGFKIQRQLGNAMRVIKNTAGAAAEKSLLYVDNKFSMDLHEFNRSVAAAKHKIDETRKMTETISDLYKTRSNYCVANPKWQEKTIELGEKVEQVKRNLEDIQKSMGCVRFFTWRLTDTCVPTCTLLEKLYKNCGHVSKVKGKTLPATAKKPYAQKPQMH